MAFCEMFEIRQRLLTIECFLSIIRVNYDGSSHFSKYTIQGCSQIANHGLTLLAPGKFNEKITCLQSFDFAVSGYVEVAKLHEIS